jgi:hypothetical protein
MDTQTLALLSNKIKELEKRVTFLSTLEQPKDTPWYDFTLLNGWANYGSGFETAQYYRAGNKRVYLKGVISGGTATQGTVLCELPEGFRPQEDIFVVGMSHHQEALFFITTDGEVILQSGSYHWFVLNTSFRINA